jgi:hypothetical protein
MRINFPTVLTVATMLIFGLSTGSVAQAQAAYSPTGVGYSPGPALDGEAWAGFITALTPISNQGPLTFETWATDADTFTINPTFPSVNGKQVAARSLAARFQLSGLQRAHLPVGLAAALPKTTHAPADANTALPVPCFAPGEPAAASFPPPPKGVKSPPTQLTDACFAEEVRRNLISWSYITNNNFNTQNGLIAAYEAWSAAGYSPAKAITFPAGAIELKADWVPVSTLVTWLNSNNITFSGSAPTVSNIPNYYYVTSGSSHDQTLTFAMVSMHISIKTQANPNWVWATFESNFNPGMCDTMGCYDQFGTSAAQAVQPAAKPNTQYPTCTKSTALSAAMAAAQVRAVFANYCLKETQVDFVSQQAATKNQPVLNGNSATERVVAAVPISSSSCISCHANAAFSASGVFNPAISENPIGNVTVQPGYMPYDFVWGVVQIP